MDERVTDVEIKLAFLEKLVSDLDGVVLELAARLDDAQREIEALKARLEQPDAEARPDGHERPPHY
jgi:uncharacterized coiled-coil protein SlyX